MNEIVKVEAPKEIAVEQVSAVKEAFQPTFEAMAELEPRYKALTDIKLVEPTKEQCGEARAVRLLLVKTRTGTATTHKTLKADALIYGRYLDGMKKAQLIACEKRESDLMDIEKHFENIEKERREQLQEERAERLQKFEVGFIPDNLADMDDDAWCDYIGGVAAAHNQRIADEKKAEEDRIVKEKAEAEERERVVKENERLKAERDEREKLETERRKLEAAERQAIEDKARKEREAHEAALQAERDEREKLERENAARQEQDRKDREAKEAAEREEAKRVADQEHRHKVEAQTVLGFMGQGIVDQGGGSTMAEKLLAAIKTGDIPNLTINY